MKKGFGVQLECWKDEDQIKAILSKRLSYSKNAKSQDVARWDEADSLCYNMGRVNLPGNSAYASSEGYDVTTSNGRSLPSQTVEMTYAFKNLRFIHAQMCANPPIAAPRPTNSDLSSKNTADTCDILIRYGMRHYKMQEIIDLVALDCLQYGTGIAKTTWDSNLGDILSVDESGRCILEGDFSIVAVNPRQFFMDPDAEHPSKIRYAFQEYIIPYEEAVYRFGKEIADRLKTKQQGKIQFTDVNHQDTIKIFEYWETGLPQNSFLGRYAICDEEGTPLTAVVENPYKLGKGGKHLKASLPFHIMTDIDVPHKLWGKSFLDYTVPLQDSMNKLDTTMLDALEAHAVYRMVLPQGTELAGDNPSNDNWDVVKITGSQPPHFISSPSMPQDMHRFREQLRDGIDSMSGVNESMFGQQSRETSGFSVQYNVNQGSMIRRRLFNKFAMMIESVYNHYLQILAQKWKTKRTISVVGKEKAMKTVSLVGADIQDGYELIVEYGTNLSLDPITRREEIMTLQPLFEKAGVSPMTSLKYMRLNDMEGHFDELELAADRQREYFEEMISTKKYVAPEPFEMHGPMLEFAIRYRMSAEFKGLDKEVKQNILKHIVERGKMKPQEDALLAPAGAAAPAPMAGSPPMPPEGMLPVAPV